MNLDFPSVPGEQTRTLEELQTVNKVDEAYNVVPTGASRLNEQKSAALKKRGHIVEEVAARAVSKQAQFYEEGKRVKKEIVEYTEVQDQTPDMPVAFINTTSRGAGQLSRKEHGGAKSEVWCTINRFKLPSSHYYAADSSKAAPLCVPQMYVYVVSYCLVTLLLVSLVVFSSKVSPAAPRPLNEHQGPNLAQLPYVLFGDEEDVQCLPHCDATVKDSSSIAKLVETDHEVPQESFQEIQANKVRTESFGLTNLEDYSRIMAKIQSRLPVYHCKFLDVQCKVNSVLELLDPSDMPRFVKNFIHQSLKFQTRSNDDQDDIAYRNKDFHQQFKEGNPDLEQLNKDSTLECEETDILLDKSTFESETVDLGQEETKSKKRKKTTENNGPNQDVKHGMKGKRPIRGNQRIKRSSRKETTDDNCSALVSKKESSKHTNKHGQLLEQHNERQGNYEIHTQACVTGLPPQNISDLASGVNKGEKTYERIVIKFTRKEEEWEIKKDFPDDDDRTLLYGYDGPFGKIVKD